MDGSNCLDYPNGLTADDRIFLYPVESGEVTSDGDFWKEWGMITEFERRWRICDHPGAVRLQASIDHGFLASYNAATTLLVASPPSPTTPPGAEITVPAAAFSFRSKYGFGLNWEQEIAKNVGVFSRLGWQDGETAAAAFNDTDWTVQLGVSIKMAAWHRPADTFGLLGNLAGASSDQQAFLKAGGTGILNGDGNLTYACEKSSGNVLRHCPRSRLPPGIRLPILRRPGVQQRPRPGERLRGETPLGDLKLVATPEPRRQAF